MKNVILASASLVAVVAATSAYADLNSAIASPYNTCTASDISGFGGPDDMCGTGLGGTNFDGKPGLVGDTEISRTGAGGQPRDPRWNGEYYKYVEPTCEFVASDSGYMTLDVDSLTWTTTSPATVQLKTVGANMITVASDNKLVRTAGTGHISGSNLPAKVVYSDNILNSATFTNIDNNPVNHVAGYSETLTVADGTNDNDIQTATFVNFENTVHPADATTVDLAIAGQAFMLDENNSRTTDLVASRLTPNSSYQIEHTITCTQ